ncbi:MAG: hypothetical protein ACOYL6_05650 [Bacteriovoracaceae bacterium]
MKEVIRANRLQEFWMAFAQGAQISDAILAENTILNAGVCALIKNRYIS